MTTSQTTTPMPWPKRPQPIWVGARNGGGLLQAEENARYERAMKEAALSRLRRLREAMLEIRSVHPLMHNGGNWDKFVDEALALCDLPNNDKEPA